MEKAASAVSPAFSPTDTEVIDHLLRLTMGTELHSGSRYVSVADVYSAPPYDLLAQHAHGGHGARYYFLSPVHSASASHGTRKSRIVAGTDGKGYWHTEAGRKEVEGRARGYKSTFSYREKTSSGTTKPGGWLMTEYSIRGYDIVIAKIYKSSRLSCNRRLQEIERFLMTDDDAGGAVDPVEYPCFANHDNDPVEYYPCFANHDNDIRSAMATQFSPTMPPHTTPLGSTPPPPLLAQGAGHYPAGQHVAAAFGHGQGAGHYPAWQHVAATAPGHGQGAGHYLAAAAAPGPGQGAGHPMLMDDLGGDAAQVWLSNQGTRNQRIPADHAHVVLGHNQTVLGAGYAQAQAQHLISEPAVVGNQRMLAGSADGAVVQSHIASTSTGLSNMELNEFELEDYPWDYHTYFG